MAKFSLTIVNFWLDFTLLVLFLFLSWISVVLHYVFPPGPQAAEWFLWGLDYVWWRNIQFTLLCIFALGVLVHVMLHWTWICGVVSSRLISRRSQGANRDDGSRTLWGVGLLIVVLNVVGLGIAAAALTIQGPAY